MEQKFLFIVVGAAVGVSLIVTGLAFGLSLGSVKQDPAKIANNELSNSSNATAISVGEEDNDKEDLPDQQTISPSHDSLNSKDVNSTAKSAPEELAGGPSSNSSKSVVDWGGSEKPLSRDHLVLPSLARNSTFVAAGDWGCNSNAKDTLQTITSLNPDLVLALGDLSYRVDTCWEELVKPIFNKTRIVIGNHDVIEPEIVSNYLRDFNLPNQYYSFDHNNVHMLVMSSEIDYGVDSPQYQFVNADLARASSNSSIDWIIAMVHRPMYTSSTNQPAPPDLSSIYHPLFDKYGVDLVLMGHNHNYQRTYPLNYNSEAPNAPIITSTSKACYDNPDGQVYLIAGTGGQSHSGLSVQKDFVVRQFSGKYGVVAIEISNIRGDNGTESIMSVGFYENGNLQTQIDQFQIIKGIDSPYACQDAKS